MDSNITYEIRLSLLVILLPLVLQLSGCQLSNSRADKVTSAEVQRPEVNPEMVKRYHQAIKLVESSNSDAALKVFEFINQQEPNLAGPYVNRGLIYMQQEDNETARRMFEAALQVNPGNAVALNHMGILLRQEGQYTKARQYYRQAIAERPGYMNAHLNLGVLCDIYLQDKGCALKHYRIYQKRQNDALVKNWLIDLQEQL